MKLGWREQITSLLPVGEGGCWVPCRVLGGFSACSVWLPNSGGICPEREPFCVGEPDPGETCTLSCVLASLSSAPTLCGHAWG